MRKKVKLPQLNYKIRQFRDFEGITNKDDTKVFIYMNLIKAVKNGIETKRNTVDLFQITGTDYALSLEKNHWKQSLNNAMEFFTDKEMYETCAECKNLIEKI